MNWINAKDSLPNVDDEILAISNSNYPLCNSIEFYRVGKLGNTVLCFFNNGNPGCDLDELLYWFKLPQTKDKIVIKPESPKEEE